MDYLPFLPPMIVLINAFLLGIVLWWAYKSPEKLDHHYTKLLIGIVAAYTIHLVHLFYNPYFFRSPIINVDYAFHYVDAVEMSRFFRQSLRIWGYNPFFSAGFPSGIYLAISNHWAFLFNLVLGKSLSDPLAFNLAILAAHFLPLPLAMLTAKNFRFGKIQTVFFVLFSSWMLEGYEPLRWFSWMGMYSFTFSVFLCLYVYSLFHRYCLEKKRVFLVGFTLTGAIAFFVHPLSALICFVLCTPFFMAHIKDLRLADHLQIAASLAIIVIGNLLWLGPYFEFHSLAEKWGFCWRSDASYIFRHPFLFSSALFLFFIFTNRWIKAPSWQKWAVLQFLIFVVITFFGSEIGFAETQPSRFIIPLALLSILCFASLLEISLRNTKRILAVCLCAASFLYFSNFILFDWADVKYYCGYRQLPPLEEVLEFIKTRTSSKSRIHIESSVIGLAYSNTHFYGSVPSLTQRETLAGQQDILHSKADFTQFHPGSIFKRHLSTANEAKFRPYLDLYNLRYFLVHSMASKRVFDRLSIFKKLVTIGDFTIYEYTQARESYCYQCQADVKADYDKITVTNAASDITTLKYHYIKTLKVKPDSLRIEPVQLLDDPIPFIRVKNGKQRDFVVYNP